jgi:hypothetical protein
MRDEHNQNTAAGRPVSALRAAGWGFFLVLAALLLVTLALLALAHHEAGRTPPSRPAQSETPPAERSLPESRVGKIIQDAASQATRDTLPDVEEAIAALFAPVRAAIPPYADFHYSVRGEYTELAEAAFRLRS